MKPDLTLSIALAVLGVSLQPSGVQAAQPSVPVKQSSNARVLLQEQGVLNAQSPVLESDGSSYQIYTFEGTAGQTVEIRLESSDFDTYLFLLDDGGETLAENDDAGNTTNSQVSVTLPTTGIYQVVVNSFSPGEQGQFALTVQVVGNGPVSQARQTCPEYSLEGQYARITTQQGSSLRVRSAPNGQVIGAIPDGWEVIVQRTDATGEWTRVTSHYGVDEAVFASAPEFQGGWVSSAYLQDLGYLCDKPALPFSQVRPNLFGQRPVTVGEDWIARGDRLSQQVRSRNG